MCVVSAYGGRAGSLEGRLPGGQAPWKAGYLEGRLPGGQASWRAGSLEGRLPGGRATWRAGSTGLAREATAFHENEIFGYTCTADGGEPLINV